MFSALFGEADFDVFDQFYFSTLAYLLFAFHLSVALVLVNLLIAMLGDTFQRIKSDTEAQHALARAEAILQICHLPSFGYKRCRPAHHTFLDGRWMMVLQELKDPAHASDSSAGAAAAAAAEAEAAQPGNDKTEPSATAQIQLLVHQELEGLVDDVAAISSKLDPALLSGALAARSSGGAPGEIGEMMAMGRACGSTSVSQGIAGGSLPLDPSLYQPFADGDGERSPFAMRPDGLSSLPEESQSALRASFHSDAGSIVGRPPALSTESILARPMPTDVANSHRMHARDSQIQRDAVRSSISRCSEIGEHHSSRLSTSDNDVSSPRMYSAPV